MAIKSYSFATVPTVKSFCADDAFITAIMGPFGCIAGDSIVITERGPVPISDLTRPVRVLSWNETTGRFGLSLSGGSFPKGMDYLYRVTTPQGEFVAAGHHLVFCAEGRYQRVDTLCPGQTLSLCSDAHSLISVLNSQLSSCLDDHRYWQIIVDLMARYAMLARLYGQRFLRVIDSAQFLVPLSSDVPTLISHFAQVGVGHRDDLPGQLSLRNHHGLFFDQRQSCDFHYHTSPQQATDQDQTSWLSSLHIAEKARQLWRFLSRFVSHYTERLLSRYFRSYTNPLSDRPIISVERLPVKQSFWDMQVLDTSNYVTADGSIHHNSGKSTGCVMKIMDRARNQVPGPDGVRRTRWGVVRNSYPQLRDTTIPTTLDWIGGFGDYMKSEYDFKLNKLSHDGHPIEATFHFRALDRPRDIRNLLSLELTGAWFNEVKEIPKRITDVMRGRVGRYPSRNDGGCTWSGILMDTNAPDTDHWFYKLFEVDKPRYCSTCRDVQGGIILFVEGQCPKCKDNIGLPFVSLYRQPSGRGPNAENLPNLEVGYYARLAAGMDKDFIRVYVDGEYGYVSDGKAVYQIFDEYKHVAKEKLKAVTDYPLIIAFDNTGRDQAAVICQYLPIGQLRVLHEFVMTDTGTRTLVREIVKPFIVSNYPGAKLILTGDPAGVRPSDTDERNTFEEISEAFGISAFPARSNTLGARLGAVESLMKRFLGGDKYGLLISPTNGILIKGFRGEYRMRRLQVVGQERYTDKPEKNLVSHIHDALQYAALAVEDSLVLTSEGSLDWGSGNVILTPSTWIAFT